MIRPLTSLYIHFPFCRQLCNYCDFHKKIGQPSDFSSFNSYLNKSFDIHENLMKENFYHWAPLRTLYLGGGTPSLWGSTGASFWESFLKKHHLSLKECEFTMEANPGSLTKEVLRSWMDLGVNRISLGVQALRNDFLKILNRVHTLQETLSALDLLGSSSINFSVDFMLGLPHSKNWKRDILKELEQILDYAPSHFSIYILTVGDNYVHKNFMPDEDWIEKEYLETSRFLRNKGYIHYEVSNFALPGKESLHNKNYWELVPMAALGPSAVGFLPGKDLAVRYKWSTNTARFNRESLHLKQLRLEKLYLSLRTNKGLNHREFFTDTRQLNSFSALTSHWMKRKLADTNDSRTTLTPQGFLLLDSLMDEIFREVDF
ncbi:MAG: coproporphyrinogen-III oxidase family protein [Halobacteriovoraceae bacterium]|nr:coproporphyrinogen-III oxidase family protein [Halobacteriovoraceae bacterium]